MAENTQDDNHDQNNTPVQADGNGGPVGSMHETSANTTDSGNGNGNAAQKQEEDDAALARMMAFQEEQQAGDVDDTTNPASHHGRAAADVGGGNLEDVDLDPNVAFLGDAPAAAAAANDDEDDNEEEAVHPNLNNPAAIALRQRQALQNAARLNPHAALQNQPYLVRKLFILLRPSLRYTPLSLLAAGLFLHHTLRTRQQFYLALVYLQSSKLAYILLGNAIIALAVSTFSLLTKLFLDGGLRPNERDSIGEHIRWDVTETCLALTIFRSELDVLTAIEFLGLVILKCLHWSVELRGSHLRMTEEVFVYPDEDVDEDDNENAENSPPRQSIKKRWYQRIPHLRLTHIRYYTLVQILLLIDIFAVAHCALSVATHGPSVDILFGFESAILLVAGLSAMGSYHLHVIDGIMGVFHHLAEGEHHHVPVGGMADADGMPNTENELAENSGDAAGGEQPQHQEGGDSSNQDATANRRPATRTTTFAKTLVARLANPWRDHRATISFAIELQAQAAKFLFYVVFFAIVFTYYGMPINIFREVYVSFQQLRRRLIAFNTYRRLTHNMDKRFESIKDEEELDRLGRTCIICRDQMDLLGGCKKLPGCGHAFHTHCLREWLVQQQTCPTCRADIAANEARMKKQLEREKAAAAVLAAAEQEAEGANVRDANNAVAADAARAEGSRTDASESQEQQVREQTRSEPNTATGGASPAQQPTSASAPGDVLPAGWTQHDDARSGRTYYYNRELGLSSWDKPVARSADETQLTEQRNATTSNATANNNSTTTNAPTTSSTDNRPSTNITPNQDLMPLSKLFSKSGFPCLYQITFPSGAPVFSPSHSPCNNNNGATSTVTTTASPDPPQRFIPRGKLIVCTSIEYWPMPFQEAMLCMPDGYVRSRDVERFLMLAAVPGGDAEEAKRRAVGVAH
eukprot:CAMPEP_0201921074 /NCGR_PEP_ID=MMETSP0903-20130614/9509_1 /ASSEMBLY_ACC=CAM_ASM_000552 /TAXON_ID=420261 /ORGANISM="Thalassiosira antarctica, Strain CCMP982" /LENGTH=917 /DNA_ID=CAMNT_0048457967 /DNA_START=32 /DNA_END=2785 /DNA_ORIENTATION=-